MTHASRYLFDPELCEVEPIHIPGHIQPFGALIATTADLHIVYLSANCDQWLGYPPEKLFRQPLAWLIGEQSAQEIRLRLENDALRLPTTLMITLETGVQNRSYETLIHFNHDFVILEIEPVLDMAVSQNFYNQVRPQIERLRESPTVTELCQIAAGVIRDITGYDRVMVYRFNDRDHHGEVLAEARADHAASFLGLHYPASDIPRSARDLFLINGVRLIADAAYMPVPLLAVNVDYPPLDLTQAVLRGVAPGHIQYLQNMGTAATCSIAIVKQNRLWGLFACHHLTPHYISPALRDICRFLGSVFSAQISAIEDREHTDYEAYLLKAVNQFMRELHIDSDLPAALQTLLPDLASTFRADGIALIDKNRIHQVGMTPDLHQTAELADWLNKTHGMQLCATNNLSEEFPPAKAFADVGSGVMALSLSHTHLLMLLWFRPESVQQITWGRQIEQLEQSPPLSPGSSFMKWQQEVHGHAEPWHDKEIRAAQELRFRLIDLRVQQITAESELQRAVLDSALNIVFVCQENRVTYINSFTPAWLGYEEHQLRAGKLLELIPVTELLRDHPGRELRNFEHQICTAEGELRWCYLNITPVFVEGQDALLVSALDITERKQALQQAIAVEIERQHIQILTDFIQNASHDFRTPLSVINTSLYLLRREGYPEQEERLRVLEEQANHLAHLVDNLLVMAQLDQRSSYEFGRIAVVRLLSEVKDGLDSRIAAKGQQIILDFAQDLPDVWGDELELSRCFSNLLHNAYQYTPVGGQILLRAEIRAGIVHIEIADTGIGIAPEDLPHIFKRFFRADKARSVYAGSGGGLGLSIARKIVEMHGGSIEVTSVLAQGSTFTVLLPAYREAEL